MTTYKSSDVSGITSDDSGNKAFDQPTSSGMNDHEYHRYLTRLLEARRYIDDFFFNKFGFPAYPYLDILLIGSGANDKIDIETIVRRLMLAPSTTKRHLDMMLECNLVTSSENGYLLTASAKELLIEFVENKISAYFIIAD